MRLHTALAKSIAGLGTDTMFGLMGDQNMHYVAEYVAAGGRFASSAHESTAISMADGFARFSGRIGVATVTHGPGVTNALTALVEAARAGTPMVLVTGSSPPGHLQNLDISAVATVAGAGYRLVAAGTEIADIAAAYVQALRERRPVMLDVPSAMLALDLEFDDSALDAARDRLEGRVLEKAPEPDPTALDAALGALLSARRPVLLGGRGVIFADARAETVELAELINAPLATTLLAKDLYSCERLNLGVCGTVSHDLAISVIAEADLLVAFGAGLNPLTTARGDLVRGKRIVACDVRPDNLGRYTAVDFPIIGDAKVVATRMINAIHDAGPAVRSRRSDDLAARLSAHSPRQDFTEHRAPGVVDTRSVMLRLNELLPAATNVVSDAGHFSRGVYKYLRVAAGYYTHTVSFGSLGLCLATAAGAAIARPDRLTLAFLGDGGFMMNPGAFNCAVRNNVPLIAVVINDGSYGAEYHKLRADGVDPAAALNHWPDLGVLAGGLGGHSLDVTSLSDLDQLPWLIEDLRGPLLVDVHVDPDVYIG